MVAGQVEAEADREPARRPARGAVRGVEERVRGDQDAGAPVPRAGAAGEAEIAGGRILGLFGGAL
jgi:hypothetical protein